MTYVLIVDDHDENLTLLRAILEFHGFRVDAARHGAEALLKARREPPQLIISDLLMPVMDGYTLLRHWKADKQLNRIPFVVYTSTYTDPKDQQLAHDLGVDAFIVKPVARLAFMAQIDAVLARQQRGELASAVPPAVSEPILLKKYNDVLVRKLEAKTGELERSNRTLQDDIVRREETEAALRASEETLRLVMETIDEVFWMADVATETLLYISPAYERVWGRTRASLGKNPRSFLDAVHPDDLDRLLAALAAMPAGQFFECEYRVIRPDATVRCIWDRGYPIRDASDKVTGYAGVAQDITERKRLEEERDRLFNYSLDMLCVAGFDGYFKQLNPAWSKTLGWTLAELKSSTWQDLVHQDDREATLRAGEQLSRGQAMRGFENRYRCKDGSYRWLSWNSYPTVSDGMLFSVVRDVTELRRTVEAVRESEEKLRLFVDFAPSAIAMFDREMRYLAFSRRWLTDYGLAEQDITGRSHYEIFPELPQRWKEVHRRCLEGATERADEEPFPRADGSVDWVRWEVHPWRTASGAIGGIILFSEVVTARKQAEDALCVSEARYRTLIEQAADAVMVAGPDGRFRQVNAAACEMFGYTRQEFVGLPLPAVVTESERERQADNLRRMMAGERILAERQFRRKDGSLFPGELSACLMEGGLVLGLVRDITERRRAEEALAESRVSLEALTRRLLEVQETERRLIASELHDEVGGVLTAVKLNLQALRRAHTAEQREAALADGLALVDGAIQSVRSLSLDLRPAVLDDLGLIPALKWYGERQAQRAGVTIDLALDAIDLKAAPQLESACFRIVQEAVTNALRHAGARRIQVTLHREDERFAIEIADDGSGYDVAAARRRGLAGESSGLLGMEERASLLGGRLSIDSVPGAGTRVRAEFVLPDGGFA